MSAPAEYWHDEALRFVGGATGCPGEAVRDVLEAQLRYAVLLGLCPPAAVVDDEFDLDTERGHHKDLLPEEARRERFVAWDREAAYVLRTTTASPATVACVLTAETAYRVRLGLMDSGAVAAYSEWA